MKKFLILSGLSLLSFFICSLFFLNSNFKSKFNSEYFSDSKNFSFSKSFTMGNDVVVKTEKKILELENINKIKIDAKTASLKIKSEEDLKDKAVFNIKNYSESSKHSLTTEDDLIVLTLDNIGEDYSMNKSSEVEILLPKNTKNIDLSVVVTFGEVSLKNLNLHDLDVDIAAGSFSGKGLKLNEAFLEVSAGEVKLTKTFFNHLNSSVEGGSAEVEVLNPAPNAKVVTSAGQIKFKVGKGLVKNFNLNAKTSFGSTNLDEGYTENSDGSYTYGKGEGEVILKADLGEINVL